MTELDRHAAVHPLEEPGEIGDLHAVQPAIEQSPQRQDAAALLAHGDDDLVDPALAHESSSDLPCRR